MIVVKPADAHACADILDPGLRGNVSESPVAIVAIKILPAKVIDHVKIGPAIAVEVAPPATKAVARVVPVETRLGSHVAKRAVPVVAHHEIRRAVLGVIIRRRILVLVGALVIDVEAKVDIQPAVAVIIGNRGSCKCSLRRRSELKRVRLLAELSAALVQEQHWASRPNHDQILPPVVIDVDNQRARCVFEDADAGRFGNVLECAVAAISIKPVRKSARLANIEVIKPVVVDVANGNAVVTVDINAASAVEHGPPVVCSTQKLRRIGSVAPERGRGDVDIAGTGGATLGFFQRFPGPQSELIRRRPLPHKLPVTDTLFTVEVAAGSH